MLIPLRCIAQVLLVSLATLATQHALPGQAVEIDLPIVYDAVDAATTTTAALDCLVVTFNIILNLLKSCVTWTWEILSFSIAFSLVPNDNVVGIFILTTTRWNLY